MPIDLQFALGFYLVFVISVTAHEAAHAWLAMRLGDSTAYEGGQVSLNPLPHMQREPFGMVVLPLLSLFLMGFPLGFAHIPLNPYFAVHYPKRAAWVSLAGPASNFLFAALALAGLRIGLQTEFFEPRANLTMGQLVNASSEGLPTALAIFGSLMLFMNLLLGLFNLIPVPPLDGAGALPLFLPARTMRKVNQFFEQPWAGLVGIIVAWNVAPAILNPAFGKVIDLLYAGL